MQSSGKGVKHAGQVKQQSITLKGYAKHIKPGSATVHVTSDQAWKNTWMPMEL